MYNHVLKILYNQILKNICCLTITANVWETYFVGKGKVEGSKSGLRYNGCQTIYILANGFDTLGA